MINSKDKRWYDKKDPTKRSIIELLFYCLVIRPTQMRRWGHLKSKGLVEIKGLSKLKEALNKGADSNKAVVIVSNHLDENDTTLLPVILEWQGLFCYKIGKLELFESFFNKLWECVKGEAKIKELIETKPVMYWSGVRAIDRGAGLRDIWTFKKLIEDHKIILTFPTGHRDPQNKTPIQIGVSSAVIGRKDEVVVLPVELIGTDKVKNGGKASVIFKDIIYPDIYPDSQTSKWKLANRVASAINVPKLKE